MALALGGVVSAAEPTAKELFDRGYGLFALGKYSEAAKLYEAAFELKPDPALLYNAAQAHRLAGNKERALLLYRNLQRQYPAAAAKTGTKRFILDLEVAIASEQKARGSQPTDPIRHSDDGGGPAPVRASTASSAPSPPPPTSEPVRASAREVPTSAPEVPANALRATPQREKRPIYKKGWFWGVVVGGAVVVAGAVALGVVYGSHDTPPMPTLGTAKGN